MSIEYKKYLKELFFNIQDDIINNLQATNNEYRELIENEIKESTEIYKILDLLNEKDREFILKNHEKTKTIEDIEKQAIYLQGFEDCIKLLKYLKVL